MSHHVVSTSRPTASDIASRLISQMNPLSSRATAITAMFFCLPRATSFRQRRHKRTCASQARSFVAVRFEGRPRSICEVLLILRDRRSDQRRTDGFRERTSSVLW